MQQAITRASHLLCLIVAALVLWIVPTTRAQEAPSARICPDGHLCQTLLDELNALIPDQLKAFNVPGAGIALIDHGKVVYSKAFGK